VTGRVVRALRTFRAAAAHPIVWLKDRRQARSPEEREAAARDRAGVLPACLAATAEAGVVFLPVQEVVREVSAATGGPLVWWPVFGTLFIGGVGLATAFRRSRWSITAVAVGATAAGVTQAVVWGRAAAVVAWVGILVLALLAGLRVATLSARDWRDPIAASVVIAGAWLLVEVAVAGGATQPWPSLIGPIVLLFFLCSLASRAASVRIEEAGKPRASIVREARSRGNATRLAVPILLGLACVLVLMVAGGGQGGFLRWIGIGVFAAIAGVLIAAAWLLSPLLVPIGWVLGLLNLDLLGFLQQTFRRLPLLGNIGRKVTGHASTFERILEVTALLGAVALLVWLIRRRRRLRFAPGGRRAERPDLAVTPVRGGPVERVRAALRPRRELPEATVRRYYAEALLALERRGLPKPDHLTPAEFAVDVERAFPTVRAAFDDLTRAYEHVRYGDRQITLNWLERLTGRRSILLETFRSVERADVAPVAVEA
jgi:hypothetical protein